MAAGKINLQKASGGITAITGVDGTGNTQLVLPESGTVATTAGATETSTGLIELATTEEAQAGTDDLKAITPLKLKNSVLGLGQTWQDVTGSRVAGVTYTNSTGKPIELSITCNTHSSQAFHISCNGAVVVTRQGSGQYSTPSSMGIVVPVGATYIVDVVSTGISRWSELR